MVTLVGRLKGLFSRTTGVNSSRGNPKMTDAPVVVTIGHGGSGGVIHGGSGGVIPPVPVAIHPAVIQKHLSIIDEIKAMIAKLEAELAILLHIATPPTPVPPIPVIPAPGTPPVEVKTSV